MAVMNQSPVTIADADVSSSLHGSPSTSTTNGNEDTTACHHPASPVKVGVLPLPSHLHDVQKAEWLPVASAIATNLPYELQHMKSIPCLERSLYSGLLAFGLVSGWTMYRRKNFSGLKYAMIGFFATSIFQWQTCRLKLSYALEQGLETMNSLHDQTPKIKVYNTEP